MKHQSPLSPIDLARAVDGAVSKRPQAWVRYIAYQATASATWVALVEFQGTYDRAEQLTYAATYRAVDDVICILPAIAELLETRRFALKETP